MKELGLELLREEFRMAIANVREPKFYFASSASRDE
jgi:hypothetical protein